MGIKITTKVIERSRYKGFLHKAREFYVSMGIDYSHSRYSSAASAGIHCAILAADASTIHSLGKKCSSDRHLDVVELIETLPLHDARRAAKHLERILDVKSYVEYTGDEYTAKEAHQLVTHVERFFRWTISVLPET